MKNAIYCNPEVSEELLLPYTDIATFEEKDLPSEVHIWNHELLEAKSANWDSEHLQVLTTNKPARLLLKAQGYGWWKI